MTKEFFDFIWKVIDKYGFNVLISFILGIITILKVPTKYIDVLPFGTQNIYWALAICIVTYTLIIAFLRYSVNEIRNRIYLSSYNAEYKKQEERKQMQQLWDQVDSFSENERNDLKKFLETENKAIPKDECYFPIDSLYNTNWIVSTEKRTTKQIALVNPTTGKEMWIKKTTTHVYKLNDNIYKLLKYSMNTYGKISNFDE